MLENLKFIFMITTLNILKILKISIKFTTRTKPKRSIIII